VVVHVDFSTLQIELADQVYQVFPSSPKGTYVVIRRNGEHVIEIGRFTEHAAYRTMSVTMQRDVKVIRAALLGVDYEVNIYVLSTGELVHSGPCLGERNGQPFHMKKNCEERCSSCGEGFE
jgi:hypothetical protein